MNQNSYQIEKEISLLKEWQDFKPEKPYWALVKIEQQLFKCTFSSVALIESSNSFDIGAAIYELVRLQKEEKDFRFIILLTSKFSRLVQKEVSGEAS